MPQEKTSGDIKVLSGKPIVEVLKLLSTNKDGLSEAEGGRRLKVYGPNEFDARKKASAFSLFASKFKNPILVVLLIAAVISGFLGSAVEAVIIVAIVITSAIVDFLNTYKSSRAVELLEDKVKITAGVVRGGEVREKLVRDIVPGDVFELEAGDYVPADAILIEEKDLFVTESAVTGESLPVEKGHGGADSNILWMGTSVISGECLAAAVRTGKETRIGKIAGRLVRPEAPTEFDRNLKDFSFFIFRITLFLVLTIILLSVFFEGKNFFQIFLFAVAIAVGIAPELLPMIVTVTLARGALKMSEGGVIVKKLSAIHNFGGIDVLCADKTGTLTEDKITLIKYTDGLGKENDEVLFWGSLSSHYVTGIRRTLDQAVRSFRKIDFGGWMKADEIPFDFERKLESVVVEKGNEVILLTKGAPEEVMKICAYYGENRERLDQKLSDDIMSHYRSVSEAGFRVLGVAIKKIMSKQNSYSKKDEAELVFMGFLEFMDPPKKTVKETLKKMAAHNVSIKIITGDNDLVAKTIAKELDLEITGVLTGEELSVMEFVKLKERVEGVNLFSRVTPEQKGQIVQALREMGHVVGFVGDGVNDVLALKAADVGISVNNAAQIAKETADIILLRRSLRIIIEGVVEGRKTFANIFKYLMMSLSSNFGNMFSIPAASLFLNFLPMTPSQILLNNLLYDSSQFAIGFDRVDENFLKKPKKFNIDFLKRFMIIFGPLSSIFDFVTFFALLRGFGFAGPSFQTGWFLESIATQTLVVNVIRSRATFKTPPSRILLLSSLGVTALAWILPFTPFGRLFGLRDIHLSVLLTVAAIVIVYLAAVNIAKKYFYWRWGYLIER